MASESTAGAAGLIVIWSDILSEARGDYLEWLSREHIPERVGIPGFLRGQRWFGESSSPQYLAVYSTTDAGVLTSAPYLERLNNPTSWTRRTMAALRNTSRMAGTLAWKSSVGTGGTILTARIFEPPRDAERLVADWSNRLLASLAAAPSIANVRVAVSATAASRLDTAERAVRVDGVAEPQVTLLVEGFGTPAALRTAFDQVTGGDPVLTGSRIDLYTLQFDLAR